MRQNILYTVMVLSCFLVGCCSLYSQPDSSQHSADNGKDSVYFINDSTKTITARKIDKTYIYGTKRERIPIRIVHKIVFSSGSEHVFNEKKPTPDSWQRVIIIRDISEIGSMKQVEELQVKLPMINKEKETVKVSAKISLRKKAARKNADAVYIVSEELKGGFGDIPKYELKGVAYRYK